MGDRDDERSSTSLARSRTVDRRRRRMARATTDSAVSNPAGRRWASRNPGHLRLDLPRGHPLPRPGIGLTQARVADHTQLQLTGQTQLTGDDRRRLRRGESDRSTPRPRTPRRRRRRAIGRSPRAWRRPRSVSGESAMPCQRFTAFHSLWPCRTSSSERSARCIPGEAIGAGTLRTVAIVRLFASARQTAGTGRDELPGRTVAEVLDAARDRYGVAFGDVLATCRIWVNGESVGDQTAIGPHDEVAILPPVSGGSW